MQTIQNQTSFSLRRAQPYHLKRLATPKYIVQFLLNPFILSETRCDTMERRESSLFSGEDRNFPTHDEDLSTIRDVTKKTFSALELNIRTCIKVTKLVDAIASNQRTGWRRLSRSGRLDDDVRRFKDYIESLRQNEEAWLALRSDAVEQVIKHDGENNAKLGKAPESRTPVRIALTQCKHWP